MFRQQRPITKQLRRLGASVDWDRERFTAINYACPYLAIFSILCSPLTMPVHI
ncbi:hypothetical protein HQQ94_05115 [Shewanella sp. VB17]|uniref:hypothetical protein n=1 Tax=Shewanella sp. VB17 TaxID=2739432 RepID=UPI0015655D57|nr:hypothetical protein [Shewanella sp. VB17]NRD72635.1 hypothetical protein [Shewanella sp. VB17]